MKLAKSLHPPYLTLRKRRLRLQMDQSAVICNDGRGYAVYVGAPALTGQYYGVMFALMCGVVALRRSQLSTEIGYGL